MMLSMLASSAGVSQAVAARARSDRAEHARPACPLRCSTTPPRSDVGPHSLSRCQSSAGRPARRPLIWPNTWSGVPWRMRVGSVAAASPSTSRVRMTMLIGSCGRWTPTWAGTTSISPCRCRCRWVDLRLGGGCRGRRGAPGHVCSSNASRQMRRFSAASASWGSSSTARCRNGRARSGSPRS